MSDDSIDPFEAMMTGTRQEFEKALDAEFIKRVLHPGQAKREDQERIAARTEWLAKQPKSLTIERTQRVTITRCYHECPYFGLEGGPGPVMMCNHPCWADKGTYAGAIISHPECDEGFPDRCPELPQNKETP